MINMESQIQRECVKWFRLVYKEPDYMIFAVPNGGRRWKIEAAILKGEGVRAGVSDLIVMGMYKIFFIEMKAENTRHEQTQKDFRKIVENLGFNYHLCRSFDEFRLVIMNEFRPF